MSQNQIIGVLHEQVDPETDVTCNFHRVTSYYVNKESNIVQATLRSYVSQKSFENGKSPVGALGIEVQINAAPESYESAEEFIYNHLAEALNPVTGEASILTNAQLVTKTVTSGAQASEA